jgi:hypothetical protein
VTGRDARLARLVTALLSWPALVLVAVLVLLVRWWYGFPLWP